MYVNAEKPVMKVCHADLQRWDPDSLFKSHCPACDSGILLVERERTSFRLLRRDRCIFCAQRVEYTDATIAGETFHVPNSN